SRDALEVFLSDSRWPWCLTKSLHWYDNLTQAGLCVRCQVSGVTYIGLSGNRGKYIDPGSSAKFYNRA
ncbi:hypothetical protein N8214_10125, partial [Pseudomonadales bacterium]|nr:hypothetical protein [Pseudomonadales bacterium]